EGGAGVPVGIRDVVLGDGERPGDLDRTLRAFIDKAALFIDGRSHLELARRHDDHLGAVLGAFPERFSRLQRALARRGEHIVVEIRAPVGPYIPVPIQLFLYERLIDPGDDPKDATAYQQSQTGQQPCDTPLFLRRRLLRAAYRLELRALLPEPRGLPLLAGADKGALRLRDPGRPRLAGRHPCFGSVEVVPAQKQRFRALASVPSPRELPEPGVLANPAEIVPQRLGELR